MAFRRSNGPTCYISQQHIARRLLTEQRQGVVSAFALFLERKRRPGQLRPQSFTDILLPIVANCRSLVELAEMLFSNVVG